MSKKRLLLTLLIILFVIPIIAAQTSTNEISVNKLGVHFGFSHYRLIDEGMSFSKIKFKGTTPSLELQFLWNTAKSNFNASIKGSNGKISAGDRRIICKLIDAELNIDYSRKVLSYKLFGARTVLYSGLKFSSTVFYIHSEDLDNLDILTVNGLYLIFNQHIFLNPYSFLKLRFSIPTISLTKRIYLDGGLNAPPTRERETMKILYGNATPTFANAYQFNVIYSKKISSKIDVHASYNFNYQVNNLEARFRSYSNSVLIGFDISLNKTSQP
jgi:hypothetical protein